MEQNHVGMEKCHSTIITIQYFVLFFFIHSYQWQIEFKDPQFGDVMISHSKVMIQSGQYCSPKLLVQICPALKSQSLRWILL